MKDEDVIEPVFPLPFWFVLIAFIVGGLWGCDQGPAILGKFSDGNGNAATFFDAPCTKEKVLALVPPQNRDMLKEAEGTYEGKSYDLCYAEVPPGSGDVFLVWEDGGLGRVPGAIKRL